MASFLTNYVIYQIKSGKARYVGHTTNYKVRMRSHLRSLKKGTHSNDFLLSEYRRTKQFKTRILKRVRTISKTKILDIEQRFINRYSNCNEGKASKNIKYDKKEFATDMIDFVLKYPKVILVLTTLGLIVGYGMTLDEAQDFLNRLYNFIVQFGG